MAGAHRELREKYAGDFTQLMEESGRILGEYLKNIRQDILFSEQELLVLKNKQNAILEAARREEEKQLELDKYKVIVTEADLLEINRLREIAPLFRNPRAIYKIIWESYYRNSTNEMISRVVGAQTITGIYKITNLLNNKIYIGQSADIASRFTQHIKNGLGIDTPNNILYTAMFKEGIENFSFEVLEECARNCLNEREIYWIDFFQSQTWGYNMSRGGSAASK